MVPTGILRRGQNRGIRVNHPPPGERYVVDSTVYQKVMRPLFRVTFLRGINCVPGVVRSIGGTAKERAGSQIDRNVARQLDITRNFVDARRKVQGSAAARAYEIDRILDAIFRSVLPVLSALYGEAVMSCTLPPIFGTSVSRGSPAITICSSAPALVLILILTIR